MHVLKTRVTQQHPLYLTRHPIAEWFVASGGEARTEQRPTLVKYRDGVSTQARYSSSFLDCVFSYDRFLLQPFVDDAT